MWPLPPPEALPEPGIKPKSLMSPVLAEGFFTTEPLGSLLILLILEALKKVNGGVGEFKNAF